MQIAAIDNRAVVHLKAWALASPFTLPPSLKGHGRLLTIGPDEWLLLSDTHSAQILQERVRADHEGLAAVSISSALGSIKLEGKSVRSVLSKCCGLDFHHAAFPLGSCARTRLASLPVILDYVDVKPRFDLYVGRSYLSYINAFLTDA